MKQYTYQALVKLLPQHDGRAVPLPGPTCRVVVRARHRETRASKIFTALLALGGNSRRPGSSHIVTLTVLGDDAGDYLDPGEGFVLWRGHDVGRGVVTHRIFVLPWPSFWYAIR